MTEQPSWAGHVPSYEGVRGPLPPPQWDEVSQNTLDELRLKLRESITESILMALRGFFIPGPLGTAFDQLVEWASSLLDVDALLQAINGEYEGDDFGLLAIQLAFAPIRLLIEWFGEPLVAWLNWLWRLFANITPNPAPTGPGADLLVPIFEWIDWLWERFGDAVESVLKPVFGWLDWLWRLFANVPGPNPAPTGPGADLLVPIFEWIDWLWERFGDAVEAVLKPVFGWLDWLWRLFANVPGPNPEPTGPGADLLVPIFKWLDSLWEAFGEVVEDVFAFVIGLFQPVASVFTGDPGNLINLFLKALKTFLPFVPWALLLPFFDWDAVDSTEFPPLGNFDPVAAVSDFFDQFFDLSNIPTLDDAGKLSLDILNGLSQFVTDNIFRPIVRTLLEGSGIDLRKLGINSPDDLLNVDLSKLGDLAGALLTSLGEIPAEILRGLLPPAVLGVVPVSSISNTSPNLLTQGSFGDSISIEAADGWTWDTSQNAPGSIGNTGAAKVTVSSAKNRYLYSRQAVPVAQGDRLILTAQAKTSGMTVSPAGSTPVTIALIPYIKNSSTGAMEEQAPVVIGSAAGPANTSWTRIGQAADTYYEVTNANWVSVIVRLGVSSAAQPLSFVWFDEVSLTKTGLLVQNNVDSLIAAFQATVGGLFGQGSPDATADWTRLFAAASQARGRADTANVNLGTTNNTLFGNTGGGTVFSNPAALIATLAGIKVDSSSTMATMISYLIDRLSAGTLSGSTADLIYWAAKKAADEAGFGFTRANYANQNLFGNPAGGNNGKVLPTALPDSLGAVGSGIIMFQVNTISSADWGPSGGYGPNTAGFKYLNDGFYPSISASATADLVYDNTGGRVGLRALRAGWYMIEVGFGLRSSVQYTYWWSFTPAIYESRTARVKYGSSVVSARDVNVLASFTLTPFNAQSSFIVYMNANDVVRPGYLAIQENNAGTGSAEILQSRNANFEGTYFSAALLNRSLL